MRGPKAHSAHQLLKSVQGCFPPLLYRPSSLLLALSVHDSVFKLPLTNTGMVHSNDRYIYLAVSSLLPLVGSSVRAYSYKRQVTMGEPAWPTCLPKWRRLDYVFLWSVAQTARFGSLADEPEAAGQICHSHSIWRPLVEPAYYYYYHYLGRWPRMFGYSPDPYPVTPQSFRILFEAIKRTKKRNVAAAASVLPLPLHFNTFITRGQCTTVANSTTWHHIYM